MLGSSSDFSQSHLSFSGTLTTSEYIQQLKEERTNLLKENQSLKDQHDRALQFTDELNNLNIKNISLTRQLQESNQRADNYQQRFQSSKIKNQELERKIKLLENEKTKIAQQEREIYNTKTQISPVKSNNSQFFQEFSQICGHFVENYEQVLTSFRNIQTDHQLLTNNLKKEIEKERNNTELIRSESKGKIKTLKKQINEIKQAVLHEKNENEINIRKLQDEITKLRQKIQVNTEELNNKTNQIEVIKQAHADEAKSMKNTINDKNILIQQLQSQVNNKNNNPKEEIKNEKQPVVIEKNLDKINDLEEIIKNQKQENLKYRNKIELAAKHIKNMIKERKTYQETIKSIKTQQKETQVQLETSKRRIEEMELKKNHEIEDLKLQLKITRESHNEAEDAWKNQVDEVSQTRDAFNLIEKWCSDLRKDFDKVSSSKAKLIEIIGKQNMLLSKYEQISSIPMKEKTRVKTVFKDNTSEILTIIRKNLNNCIKSQTKRITIESILNSNEQEETKINKILRELGKEEKSHFDSIASITAAGFEQLLHANVFIGNKANVDLINDKLSSLERFSKNTFFFSSSFESRKAAIESIKREGWNGKESFDLFIMMSFINLGLNEALLKAAKINEDLKIDLKTIIKKMNKSTKEIGKLRDENQELYKKSEELESIANDQDKIIKAMKKQTKEKSNVEEELRKENEKIKQENAILSSSIESIEVSNKELKLLCEQQKQRIENLVQENDKIKFLFDHHDEEKNELLKQIHDSKLKQDEIIRAAKIRLNKKADEIEAHKREMAKLNEIQKDLKNKFDEAIEVIKKQREANSALQAELNSQNDDRESQLRELERQNLSLKKRKKILELSLTNKEEEMKREREVFQSQFAVQKMSFETRNSESLNEMRRTCEENQLNLMIYVLEAFDYLDEIDDVHISESRFKEIVEEISSKIKSNKIYN